MTPCRSSITRDLLRYIKTNFPTIHIHAFSPPEFIEFERFFKMDVREIIRRFHAAGLDTIPGGGGEIFAPRVRRRIGLGKCSGDDWMRVMRVAHEEGLNTSCTMLIGHIEFLRERSRAHVGPAGHAGLRDGSGRARDCMVRVE